MRLQLRKRNGKITRVNQMKKLKPCPFCMGTHVDVIELSYNVFVECEDCAAQGPAVFFDEVKAQETAIKLWNIRGSIAAQKQRINDETQI